MSTLPTSCYRDNFKHSLWNEVPLGVDADGNQVTWNLTSHAHILVAGHSGRGKTTFFYNLFLHAAQHADKFSVIGIDPSRGEFFPFRKYDVFEQVVDNGESAYTALLHAQQEMYNRYYRLDDEKVSHYRSLSSAPKALIVAIDEIYQNLHEEHYGERIRSVLTDIAHRGRAVGVHLVAGTQDPRKHFIGQGLLDNFSMRIVLGRVSQQHSLVMLGSSSGSHITPITGRAIMSVDDQERIFQTFFVGGRWLNRQLDLLTQKAIHRAARRKNTKRIIAAVTVVALASTAVIQSKSPRR